MIKSDDDLIGVDGPRIAESGPDSKDPPRSKVASVLVRLAGWCGDVKGGMRALGIPSAELKIDLEAKVRLSLDVVVTKLQVSSPLLSQMALDEYDYHMYSVSYRKRF